MSKLERIRGWVESGASAEYPADVLEYLLRIISAQAKALEAADEMASAAFSAAAWITPDGAGETCVDCKPFDPVGGGPGDRSHEEDCGALVEANKARDAIKVYRAARAACEKTEEEA